MLSFQGLSFPAGATPGFDQTHPCAQTMVAGHGFSGVATPAGFMSLLSGRAGVLTGGILGATLGNLGPVTDFSSSTSTATFPGQSTKVDTVGTMAAIFQFNSLTGGTTALTYSSTTITAGMGLCLLTGSSFLSIIAGGATNATSTIAVASSVPYFAIASTSTASSNFLLMRLDNGKIVTNSQGPAIPTANNPSGSYQVGNAVSGRPTVGKIAACAFSFTSLSPQQMLVWAQKPWAFWYPTSLTVT